MQTVRRFHVHIKHAHARTFVGHLVIWVVLKGRRVAQRIHVFIPLISWSVEETPAGCILRRRHTTIRTAQHGHHVVLDGTCHGEVLQEPGSAVKQHAVASHHYSERKLNASVLFCLHASCWPVFHVPEDCCAPKPGGNAKVWIWFGKGGQEVAAAASILPRDQLTGVSGCEEIPAGPITTCKRHEAEMLSCLCGLRNGLKDFIATTGITLSLKTNNGIQDYYTTT